jgi:hypothetical protein
MWTKSFWKQAAERATKSAAQALVLLWAGDGVFNSFTVNAGEAAGIALGAAALSVLTSIVTSGVGEKNSPSAVGIDGP